MKFKIISMLITLTAFSVVPLIYMGKFDPLSFFDSGHKQGATEFSRLKDKAPKGLSSVVSDEKVQVYKWRDENGVMQFSNTAPKHSLAEQIVLDPNSNLIQAVKVPVKAVPKEEESAEATSPYSVQGMKKVMDDAKGVEALLQQRHEKQQEMLKNY